MIYLYYFDGKLSKSPTKMQSESELVESLNKWTSKIDATHGATRCYERLRNIVKKAKDNKDYHILTNSFALKQLVYDNLTDPNRNIYCLFEIGDNGHWTMTEPVLPEGVPAVGDEVMYKDKVWKVVETNDYNIITISREGVVGESRVGLSPFAASEEPGVPTTYTVRLHKSQVKPLKEPTW